MQTSDTRKTNAPILLLLLLLLLLIRLTQLTDAQQRNIPMTMQDPTAQKHGQR
jgi:hypothetical protein